MKMKKALRIFSAALPALLFSCAAPSPAAPVPITTAAEAARPVETPPPSAPVKTERPAELLPPKPRAELRFIPRGADAPAPVMPAAVGAVSADSVPSAERRSALAAAFRAAYEDALARGVPLTGVLGGDRVHFWSPPVKKNGSAIYQTAGAYVQNWREPQTTANPWGLKDLVLACVPSGGDRVFLVRGAILAAYGSGAGIGGANGVIGYGAPLGDEFVHDEGLAQRFEYGLLLAKKEGGAAFFIEDPPSATGVPDDVAQVPSAFPADAPRFGAAERNAIRSAWSAAVNSGRPPAPSDGPVLWAGGAWGSVWIQTFGAGTWGIVLPAEKGGKASARARILDRWFLEAVGGRTGTGYDFTDYGLPVSDSFVSAGIAVQLFEKGRLEAMPPRQ